MSLLVEERARPVFRSPFKYRPDSRQSDTIGRHNRRNVAIVRCRERKFTTTARIRISVKTCCCVSAGNTIASSLVSFSMHLFSLHDFENEFIQFTSCYLSVARNVRCVFDAATPTSKRRRENDSLLNYFTCVIRNSFIQVNYTSCKILIRRASRETLTF